MQTVHPGTLLWEEQGVRVFTYQASDKPGKWYLTIENTTDKDIRLSVVDVFFDGTAAPPYSFILTDSQLGAGQRTIGHLSVYLDEQPLPKDITFYFQVRSFDNTSVLFAAEESTTLSTQ